MTGPAHRDFEPFELGENMEEDLGLFEAATHAVRFDVGPLTIRHVLAATARGAAVAAVADGLAARLSATRADAATDAADAILAAAARFGDAVVVASAALPEATIAALVAPRSDTAAVPVVLVPDAPAGGVAALDVLVLPLFADAAPTRRACVWACGLAAAAAPRGVVHAVELASPATRRAARRLRPGPSAAGHGPGEAAVGRVVAGGLGSIVAGLQRHATRHGTTVDVTFRGGRPVADVLAVVRGLGRLATVVLGRDDAATGQPLATDLAVDLVRSRAAVLIVV
jgi:hypothetical protein